MARHIIRTLQGVGKILGVLRHQPAEKFLEISSSGRIRIFKEDKTCARMFYQNGCRAVRYTRLADNRSDSIGDLVGANTMGRNRKSCAKSLHHTPTEQVATTSGLEVALV